MPHQPGLPLVIALVALVILAIAASWAGRLKVERSIATAAARAVVQLAAVALVITAVLSQLAWSLVFAAFMFGVESSLIAAYRGSRWPGRGSPSRSGAASCPFSRYLPLWRSALERGVSGADGRHHHRRIDVGAVVDRSTVLRCTPRGARKLRGSALHRSTPPMAIGEVIERRLPEALVPALDQTRTVGLVTLPGAFVGVLLGGGTPIQAGAVQVLVLVGLLAAETAP